MKIISKPSESPKNPMNTITGDKINQAESRSQCKQLDLTFKEEDIEEVSIDRKLIYESNESDEDEKHLVNQIVKVEDENYPTLFGDLLPNIDYETNRVKTEYEIDDSYEDVKTETCGEELNENKFDLEEYTFSKVERSHDEEIEPNASLEFIAGYVDNIHSHTSTSQDNFLPKDHEENPREGQFSQKPNIKDHEEGHTKYEVKRPFQCDLCPKSFILKKMLILHRYTHTREIFLKCKYCSEYYTRSAILTHMEIHDVEKPYLSNCCNQSFTQKHSRDLHEKRHRGEKPHQCNYCPKSFVTKYDLSMHLKVHETPYQCKFCNQPFRRKYKMIMHEKLHRGEKPYQCNYCPNSFVTRYELKNHVKEHDRIINPYQCEYCHKSFRVKSDLNEHKKIHIGEKLFYCDRCSRSFATRSGLRSHLNDHIKNKKATNVISLRILSITKAHQKCVE